MEIALDDGSLIVLKEWKNIDPNLIGSDYNRYEIVKWQNETSFVAWVKMPCKGMDGCDRCAGPHRPKNRQCSQNWNRPPNLPTCQSSGIVLMELHTNKVWSGIWNVQSIIEPLGRKSGIAILSLF